jgi:sensor c-di-GMP phosphodiesterase-like protein
MQGFMFSKPLAVEQFLQLVADQRATIPGLSSG